MKCNYNVNTKSKSKYIVITKHKSNYKIITLLIYTYFIIIFLPFSCFALTFNSDLYEGQLVYGKLEKGESIFIEEYYLNIGKESKNKFKIPNDKNGNFIIGIPQDATELNLYLNNSKKITFPVKKIKWNEEIVNGLSKQKVILNQSDKERIEQEINLLRFARQNSNFPDFPNKWQHPVPNFTRISSHFGSRRILNNTKKQGHSGVDYAAPINTPIYSPANGTVVLIHEDMFYSGKTILIDHGYGVFSSYSHLNKINIKENQSLKTGDIIGYVGSTGRSTGPHLHFTITWYGVRVDPDKLFK